MDGPFSAPAYPLPLFPASPNCIHRIRIKHLGIVFILLRARQTPEGIGLQVGEAPGTPKVIQHQSHTLELMQPGPEADGFGRKPAV